MKKLIFPLILILFLTSCIGDENIGKDTKITELEKQIQILKGENNKLQQENELLKIGGIPSTIQTSSSGGTTIVGANSLFPEGSTFE
ncbi:hypothetical protein K2X92_05765, partial [Candidatus Gracilibacteria bacterium]|nr:hypothetical protein [Candidatus Gracilibacteria bacterium]